MVVLAASRNSSPNNPFYSPLVSPWNTLIVFMTAPEGLIRLSNMRTRACSDERQPFPSTKLKRCKNLWQLTPIIWISLKSFPYSTLLSIISARSLSVGQSKSSWSSLPGFSFSDRRYSILLARDSWRGSLVKFAEISGRSPGAVSSLPRSLFYSVKAISSLCLNSSSNFWLIS